MPVTFAPADPFSAAISSGYGQIEQFDKTLPTFASLYEAKQRNLAGLQSESLRAQQAGLEMDTRRSLVEQQNQQQDREAQQHMAMQLEMQSRAQQFQAAMQDRQMTYADDQHNNRLQQGLSAIQEAVGNGTLTEEEAGPLAMQMRTGIDMFKQRREKEQAANQSAMEKLHLQQAGLQNAVLLKNQEIQSKSATDNAILDPAAKLAAEEKLRPQAQAIAAVSGEAAAQNWLNEAVRQEVIKKGAYSVATGVTSHGTMEYKHMEGKPGAKARADEVSPSDRNEWGYLARKGTNELDEQKAQADAEKWAKFHTDKVYKDEKTASGDTKRVLDHEATDAAIADTSRRRMEGIKREFNQAEGRGPRQQDEAAQQQDPQAAFERKLASNTSLTNTEKSQASGTYTSALALARKPGLSLAEKRQLQDMLEYLEKVQGK